MSGHTITVALPAPLYEHLKQRAEQRQRTIEEEVLMTLAAAWGGQQLAQSSLRRRRGRDGSDTRRPHSRRTA